MKTNSQTVRDFVVKLNTNTLYCTFDLELPERLFKGECEFYDFKETKNAEVVLHKVTIQGSSENILYLLQDWATTVIEKEIAIYIGTCYNISTKFWQDYK